MSIRVNNSEALSRWLYYSFKRDYRSAFCISSAKSSASLFYLAIFRRPSCSIFRPSIMDTPRTSSSGNFGKNDKYVKCYANPDKKDESRRSQRRLCRSRFVAVVRHSAHFSSESRKDRPGVSLTYGFSIKAASSEPRRGLTTSALSLFTRHSTRTSGGDRLIQFSAAPETHREKNRVIASRAVYARRFPFPSQKTARDVGITRVESARVRM